MARFSLPTILVAAVVWFMASEQCEAFAPLPSPSSSSSSALTATLLSMSSPKNDQSSSSSPLSSSAPSTCSRRDAFAGVAKAAAAGAASFVAVGVAAPPPAVAKYSDYARREKDWEERSSKGVVKVSSARDLRAQLQEIAPMNSASSTIFCPNGPSANVSPLMENKCGDRMAAPSVYGRSNDSMGNSVPGFKDGYAWSPGEVTSVSAAAGGFPVYKEHEWKLRDYGK